MSKTLGLDIGTNSIGWCLIEDNKKIIDIGVRIFPVGVKDDDYNKSGKEISKNAARRTARGIRRLYDRYKLRRKQLKRLLFSLEMIPPEHSLLTSMELYELRKTGLDKKISLKDIGRIFLLLNQRRGFKSNKKDAKTDDAKKEKSEIKLKMNELSRKVEESDCRTLGEYFYSLFEKNKSVKNWHNPDEPVEKIRSRFVYRELYEKEFDKIWEVQKKYYPDILTDENHKKIKDNCIFYQRPLKSQKHLVGRCRFEPKKRVSPKSSFEFQEFRIWTNLNNLRINSESRFRDPLSIEEKKIIAEYLNLNDKISKNVIKKLIGLSTRDTFNDMPDKMYGNTTFAMLSKALGKDFFEKLEDKMKYKLWHTLYFANDEEWLFKYSKEKLLLNDEQAANYVELDLEPDYSNISVKAIRKILPFLKEGYDYAKSCELAGYHHSKDKDEVESKDTILPDKIEIKKEDNLRNPLVQQSVSESIRLVNSIIKEYGKPDRIRVEFARELKKPKNIREQMKKKNDNKNNLRDSYKEFLKEKKILQNVSKSDILKFELWLEMEYNVKDLKKLNGKFDIEDYKKFAKDVKPSDKEKYKLYLECGRISPYTGKVISLKELFSSDIEIEHIIPYSKCMDDSFLNKTLSEKEFNERKGNLTPYQYFKERPEELHSFKERIKHFIDAKQEKFMMEVIPDDFLHSQLTNNAYIATEVRKKLKTVCRKVYVTNGQATSALRNLWELNKVINPDGKNEKSRLDHRHHAIDALVIANTNQEFITLLSTSTHFTFRGKLKAEHFPYPYNNFFEDASERINEILISYRNKKRLVTSKKNKYAHSRSSNKNVQKTYSIRGTLHEESLYGQIINPNTGKNNFVIRKPVTSIDKMKQVEKIVDNGIRKIIIDHIEKNGGEKNIKKAMALPITMKSRDGKKEIPVNSVRIIDNAESMIMLRPNENKKLFVSSGSNYMIAIYEDENGKRDFQTISFFDAVNRSLKNEKVVKDFKSNKKLVISLKQNDMVLTYDKSPDEIDFSSKTDLFNRLYKIIKFDVNGIIYLGKHYVSKYDLKKDRNDTFFQVVPNTFKAVKVNISNTGKLMQVIQ